LKNFTNLSVNLAYKIVAIVACLPFTGYQQFADILQRKKNPKSQTKTLVTLCIACLHKHLIPCNRKLAAKGFDNVITSSSQVTRTDRSWKGKETQVIV